MSLLLLLGVMTPAQTADRPAGFLAEGTPFATPYYIRDSGVPGPTVLITGGIHGNEPSGARAADQIRHWPITRGKLIVVPRVNVLASDANQRNTPGEPESLANLNRNFPRAASNEPPRCILATAVWNFACQQKPNWVIDLHEGYDFSVTNKNSVGSSLLVFPTTEGQSVSTAMQAAVNATITNQNNRFQLRGPPVDSSFARAAGAHLGAHAMILETTTKSQPLPVRVRQHRIMVHTLLRELQMIPDTANVDWITDQSPAGRATLRIALYDAAGTGGTGPQKIRQFMSRKPATVVVELGPEEIRNGALSQFHVLICPGGSGLGQANAIGKDGRERIKQFVENGGGYVGICAGAYLATSGFTWGLKILNAKTVSPKWRRGTGIVKIELTDKGRQLLGNHPGLLDCKYANGPILGPAEEPSLPDYDVLAVFRSEIAEHDSPKGIMVNSPAIVAAACGKGRVIAISPHPEQMEPLQELVARAIFWAAGRDDYETPEGKKILADCSMLRQITKDDPPIIMTCNLPDTEPENRGHLVHHPRHAKVIKQRCDEVGVKCEIHLNAPGDVIGFLLQHLGVQSTPAKPAT